LIQAGDLHAALELARAIEADAPMRPAAHARVAQILTLLGREDEARAALLEAARKLRPHAAVLTPLGLLAQKQEDFTAAAGYFAQAAALEPANAAHRMRQADSLARAGDLRGAIAAQREAVHIAPQHKPFSVQLAALEAQLAAQPATRAPTLANPGPTPGRERARDAAPHAASGPATAANAAPTSKPATEPARPPAPPAAPAVLAAEAVAPAKKSAPAQPQAKTALLGADGYYFHEVDLAFPQICEAFGSDGEVRRLLTLWEMRHGWCAARGITYRQLIVPEKHAIYADKLPPGWRLHPDRAAARLMRWRDALLQDVVIYPLAEITAGRALREVCFRQDVHWTNFGAYLAYCRLIETLPELAAEMVRDDELSFTTRRAVGDIAIWLDMRAREEIEVAVPPKITMREIFSTKSFATGQVDVFHTDHPGGRRLVLFRTSNSTALMPYLARHFSRIVAVAATAMMTELIQSEQPDMVFCEMPERYLAIPFGPATGPAGGMKIKLPRDLEADVFADMTGCTLPLPKAAGGR